MKTLLKLLALLLVIALAVLLFIYSGVYNVAASSPDTGLVAWALRTTQERSVHRAYESLEGKVTIPRLDDPAMIQSGFVHYHEMCLTCHGGPGIKASEIGQGLNPFPPELTKEAEEPLESFWIVKHGIKMTGMPAFGGTHTDDEIWAIVAFLDRLPKLSPEEYQAMVQQAGLGPPEKHEHGEQHGEKEGEAGGHTHPPGTPAHTD
jgi:mono/diheme cytochrome c family protein